MQKESRLEVEIGTGLQVNAILGKHDWNSLAKSLIPGLYFNWFVGKQLTKLPKTAKMKFAQGKELAACINLNSPVTLVEAYRLLETVADEMHIDLTKEFTPSARVTTNDNRLGHLNGTFDIHRYETESPIGVGFAADLIVYSREIPARLMDKLQPDKIHRPRKIVHRNDGSDFVYRGEGWMCDTMQVEFIILRKFFTSDRVQECAKYFLDASEIHEKMAYYIQTQSRLDQTTVLTARTGLSVKTLVNVVYQ